MVYQDKLVAAIKCNGQVLREVKNTVTIPFGSEYSVFLKNLNSVRILVRVSIDGKDATEGTWLIVQPNSNLELERYIRNGNLEKGNRFKFIQRTKEIESHRGIGADDGIVRVEYKTEIVEQEIRRIKYYDEYYPVPRPYFPPRPYPRPWHPRFRSGPMAAMRSMSRKPSRSTGDDILRSASMRDIKMRFSAGDAEATPDSSFNDAGITVAGSESNQKFVAGEWFATEKQSQVLILHLRGKIEGKSARKAITVKHKLSCDTCGKSSKAGSQFCAHCGTSLTLI